MPFTVPAGTLVLLNGLKGNDMHVNNAAPAASQTLLKWRIFGWGSAGALLITPLIAMQFSQEVTWDETDFLVAAIIFATVGGLVN